MYLRVLPCVCAHLLAKMDSSEEAYGYLTSLTMRWRPPPPFLTSKEPFCTCVVKEVSLIPRMRNSGLLSLIWAGPNSSIILFLWSFCYYGVSVHRGETVQPGAHLSPASIHLFVRSFFCSKICMEHLLCARSWGATMSEQARHGCRPH